MDSSAPKSSSHRRSWTWDWIVARSCSSSAPAIAGSPSNRRQARTHRIIIRSPASRSMNDSASSVAAHHAHVLALRALDEEVAEGVLGVLRRELRLDAFELAGGQHLFDDELGLEVGERSLYRADRFDHLLIDALRQLQPLLRRHRLEHLLVEVLRRLQGLQLVADAALECGIHQVIGMHVGGKDHDLVERDLQALAAVQAEIVDAAVEWHDPAIENLLGLGELAPEVVDQERAVERLHVQRRFIELGDRIELEVEHLERELAAGDHHRAIARHPAPVDRTDAHAGVGVDAAAPFHRAVNGGIVDLHDLATEIDAIGYEDHVLEDLADDFGHRGLAVA